MRTTLISLILGSLLVGCTTVTPSEPIPFKPDSSLTNVATDLNGVDLFNQYAKHGWLLTVQAIQSKGGTATCMQPGINIQIDQFGKYGLWYSHISLWLYHDIISQQVIPLNEITTCLSAASFHTMEGDVSTGYFRLVPGADNRIQIDTYNKETGEISGRFQCQFVPDGPNNRYSFLKNVDTLRFTNGRFKTVVKKGR